VPLLDELSGFEFEETMASVFRKQGYEDVQVSRKTADKGRDIIMQETVASSHKGAVIVECKHTDVVGRPVIQKLDSAVSTYGYEGPKRGLVVTTGRFTKPAREYAGSVDIELMDGNDLRSVADDVGLDLYNGRIEIICDEMLDPYYRTGEIAASSDFRGPVAPILEQFEDVENISPDALPSPETTLTLLPAVSARMRTKRQFETGAGVIHSVDDTATVVFDAARGEPTALDEPVKSLVKQNIDNRREVNDDSLETQFDSINKRRFGRTETEYREWLTEQMVIQNTESVSYTGDNNVDYQKECEPKPSDVTIQSFKPLFAPRIYGSVKLQDYSYSLDWFAASDEVAIVENRITECVHCEAEAVEAFPWDRSISGVARWLAKETFQETHTYCENCGAIACQEHTRQGTVTGEPICIDCAVTQRYAGAKKYFSDDAARETFSEQYAEKASYEKALVNRPAIIAFVLMLVAIVFVFAL